MNKPPIIQAGNSFSVPPVETSILNSGVTLSHLSRDDAEYVSIDIVFEAGRYQEKTKMASKMVAALMKEGIEGMTGKEISEFIDVRGASFAVKNSLDHISVKMLCLYDHAQDIIPLLGAICYSPTFLDKDVQKLIKRQIQRMRVDLRKPEVVAYRQMTSLLFGEDSPYGYNSTQDLYNTIRRDDLLEFHNRCIRHGRVQIFAAGKIDDRVINLLDQSFGSHEHKATSSPVYVSQTLPLEHQYHYDLPQAAQTSIRLACHAHRKDSVEYGDWFMLNMVLGGYFGARLMTNIREKMGLTYGIYSSYDTLKNAGYFFISTETRHENVGVVLEAISRQAQLLRSEELPVEELEMTKNYILGQFLRMVDGPLNVMKLYRTLAADGKDFSFFESLMQHIRHFTSSRLKDTAQLYLDPQRFLTLTVGRTNPMD